MKKNIAFAYIHAFTAFFITSTVAFAEEGGSRYSLSSFVSWVIENVLNSFVIPFFFSLIFIAFFWRNIVALAKREELVQKNDFKYYLLWAVIALTIVTGIWGILNILTDVIGIEATVPQITEVKAPERIQFDFFSK